MRIYIKGGIWKNSEDEILKAAVMKYGKNQWARCSSLLIRKSPKQCKARWHEWLDPSIKKTQWSREEEEKLLHLAKIMPNQWRTIAPIVGRTAAQCLQHYERLLDEAQRGDGEPIDPSEDPRRLRPGEIDPTPETKPARPDPVDMDEDEKEMLQEARARLANTRGKKAKRKARERQLDLARRLATLQKKRELRAAGIDAPKFRLRTGQIDFNKEIPFQRPIPIGLHAVPAYETPDPRLIKLRGSTTQLSGGPSRRAVDEKEKHNDRKRVRAAKEKNKPKDQNAAVMDALARARRNKLSLSSPQLSDADLQELVEMGNAVDLQAASAAGHDSTRGLLSNYGTPAPGATPMRTPRTATGVDHIRREAENLIALSTGSTPLLGGVNQPLHDSDFGGITPQRKAVATPNVYATPGAGATPGGALGRLTPGGRQVGMTPGKTPVRDALNLNNAAAVGAFESKRKRASHRQQLRSLLDTLPAPVNQEFEVEMPELEPDDEAKLVKSGVVTVADEADIAAEKRKKAAAELEERRANQCEVLKRGLPRPTTINTSVLRQTTEGLTPLQLADELINREMMAMMAADHHNWPLDGSLATDLVATPPVPEGYMEEASALMKAAGEAFAAKAADEHGDVTGDDLHAWVEAEASAANKLVYSQARGRFVKAKKATEVDLLQEQELQLNRLRAVVADDAKAARKMERKLDRLTAGFQRRATKDAKRLVAAHEESSALVRNLVLYRSLQEQEQAAIPARIGKLQGEIDEQLEREAKLQTRYANLTRRLRELKV